jgi:hypothetical protein
VARTIQGNKYLKATLVESGWGATRKKDGFLKRKYENLVGRRGRKKALIAIGHKIIVAAYHVIRDKQAYKEPVLHDNPRRTNKQIRNYLNRFKELGIDNVLIESLEKTLKGRIVIEQQEVSRS